MSLSSLLGLGTQSNLAPSGTVVTQESLAKEIAPFWKDLLEKSQALYQSRIDEGYKPYQQPTMAKLTPEQLKAMQGLRDLVGTQDANFKRSQELLDKQSEKFTADTAKKYMSPYQQAVTDIEKREAQKVFERDIMPTFEKRAVDAGGMSGLGSRAGLEASQIGQAQMRQLEDIQTKGSQRAYDAAVRQFQEQKARERMEAQAQTQLGTQRYGAKARELGGLSSVGETLQQRQQAALDEAYKRHLEESKWDEDQLQRYQGTIVGFPDIKSQVRTTSAPQTSPFNKFLSQAAGLGSLYGSFGGFSPGGFGSAYTNPFGASSVRAAEGGHISDYLSALSTVPEDEPGGAAAITNKPRIEPQPPKIDETKQPFNKLIDMMRAAQQTELKAKQATQTAKETRMKELREAAKQQDIVGTLARLSVNLDKPNTNVFRAFGETQIEMEPSRKKFLNKMTELQDANDLLTEDIATAEAKGDLDRATRAYERQIKLRDYAIEMEKVQLSNALKTMGIMTDYGEFLKGMVNQVGEGQLHEAIAVIEQMDFDPKKKKELINLLKGIDNRLSGLGVGGKTGTVIKDREATKSKVY